MNTTQPHPSERAIQLCIIISLLLHAGCALFIATNNLHQSFLEQEMTENKKIIDKNESEWVETKTRPSAPIFFRDDYDQSFTDEELEENDDNPAQAQDNQEDNSKQKFSEISQEKISEIKKQIDTTTTTVTTQTSQPKNQPKRSHNISSPIIRPIITQQRTQPTQKKLPSLAQLTQGMLNYMQESGNHSVSMLGKKGGTPTDEQLKYERYLERLNHCLHNSFVINAPKQPPHSLSDDASITVYLALNQDGSIYNLKLVKTSGDRTMDYYVMSVLRDASTSFPPVPHYLPHNPFSIHYIIKLGHAYRYR